MNKTVTISAHAIDRYRERVANVTDEEARNAILAGLRAAIVIEDDPGGLLYQTTGPLLWWARMMHTGVVTTILHDPPKAKRSRYRRALSAQAREARRLPRIPFC